MDIEEEEEESWSSSFPDLSQMSLKFRVPGLKAGGYQSPSVGARRGDVRGWVVMLPESYGMQS